MELYLKVMKALSDHSRVKILKILQIKELCVCEIRSLLGFSQPTISKHLKILEEAGLVESHKDKMWVNYKLSGDKTNVFALTSLENLHDWLAEDPELKSLLKTVPAISRNKVKHETDKVKSKHLDKQVGIYPFSINHLTKENLL